LTRHGADPIRRYLELILKLLPEARQEWASAMRAEFEATDSRSERLRFAAGCTRVAITQAVRSPRRVFGVTAATGVGLVAEGELTRAIGQTVPLVVALALLGWLGRRPGLFGPVRADFSARTARLTGYGAIVLYVLASVIGFGISGLAHPDAKAPFFALLLTLCAAGTLATTAQGSRFSEVGLITGACAGLAAGFASFVVMPFERSAPPLAAGLPLRGSWLVLISFGAPAAAALITARRTRRADQGVMAALYAGSLAALLIALLGLSAIVLFPDRVPDLVGPVMVPGTSAAARHAANATEASDPYAGLLLLSSLLAATLWAMARPLQSALPRGILLTIFGTLSVWLALSAKHFPGSTAIAIAVATVCVAALIVLARAARDRTGIDLSDTALS
jgi:hypothetical protein